MKITKYIVLTTLCLCTVVYATESMEKQLAIIKGNIDTMISGDAASSGETVNSGEAMSGDDSAAEEKQEVVNSKIEKKVVSSAPIYNLRMDVDFSDLITQEYDAREKKYYEVINPYRREILMAARIGFIDGYEDGTFKPDNSITRAEFIKMLMGLATNRTFNIETIPTKYTNWAGKYVSLAEMQGIIEKNKYTDEELEKPITRLEVVCMLAKVQIKMKGITQKQIGHLIYTDIDALTEEEKGLLLHAASYELLEGMKDGSMKKFEPTKNITRAETAAALIRIY